MKEKVDLLIKTHKRRKDLYTIILNDYRIAGVRCADIYDDEANFLIVPVSKENLKEALKGLFEEK